MSRQLSGNRWLLGLVVLVLAFAAFTAPAKADTVIDFSGLSGGSASFTPTTGNSLSINAAPISLLSQLLPPGSSYAVSSGSLSFQSGGAISVVPCLITGTCATFDQGGSLSLVGGISGLPFGIDIPNGTTLLQGDFVNGMASFMSGIGNFSGLFNISYMDPNLLAAFGYSPDVASFGSLSTVFFYSTQNGSLTGSAGSTNLLVTLPEPGTLLLLGAGLIAAAFLLRWRLSGAKR